MELIDFDHFLKVDIRVGTVIEANDFPKARKPAYQLKIDFGDQIGVKKTSAQITELYKKDDLINRKVCCIINFKPKQITNFISECLVLGVYNNDGKVVLLGSSKTNIKNGTAVS